MHWEYISLMVQSIKGCKNESHESNRANKLHNFKLRFSFCCFQKLRGTSCNVCFIFVMLFFLKIRRQNSNALVIKSHLKQVDQIVRLIISYGNSGFFIKYWQTSLVQIIDVAVFYKNIQILSILSLATRRDTRPKFPASTAVPVLAFPFSFLEVPVNRWTEWLRSPLNIKEANEQAKIYVIKGPCFFFFLCS